MRRRLMSVPDLLATEEWDELVGALELSPREAVYLRHAFENPRDDAIAERMGITTHGAHAHRIHLFRKLGVDSMARALAVVFCQYLLQHRDRNWTASRDAIRNSATHDLGDQQPIALKKDSVESTNRL